MEGNKNVEISFLGNSGVKISNICLGTGTFGRHEDQSTTISAVFRHPKNLNEEGSHKVMDRYLELGGNFIDTADIYCAGESERIVGTWLQKQNRDDIVIASKTGFPKSFSDFVNPNSFGLSRRHIIQSVEESLRRLQTNFIDLYQAHMWDNGISVEETLRTFNDLIQCGKIRYFGYSNVCGWQMQKIVQTTKLLGLNPCVSLQQQYSLLHRHSEWEEFMVCENEGIGVLTWSPLKSGLLSGKFKRDQVPDPQKSRIGFLNTHPKEAIAGTWDQISQNDQYWKIVEVLEKIAQSHGKTVAQVAIRWLLQRKWVTSVIIGATSIQQLEDNMGAGNGWQLSEEEMDELNTVSNTEATYPYDMLSKLNETFLNPYRK